MDGVIVATGDWRDIHAALVAAYPDFATLPDAERTALWSAAEKMLKAWPRQYALCSHCTTRFHMAVMYRCTDCGTWLCKDHWRPHFGPNHRPHLTADTVTPNEE